MKIRRTEPASPALSSGYEIFDGEAWTEPPPAQLPGWLADLPVDPATDASTLLPVSPRSFRDCMLYRAHWIQSSRGFVKRFMPPAYRIAQFYERVTGATFPPYRPKALLDKQPIYYFGNHLNFVVSGTPVHIPRYTQALDYELELAFVLSKSLFNANVEEAWEAIGGFIVLNDLSARDVQFAEMKTGLGPQKAKHFLSSLSREMVTADELLQRTDRLRAYVELNGKRVTETTTAGIEHSLGETVAFLSMEEQLYPGELIATGTLPGGSGIENGRLLQAGDRLRLIIEEIGEITHEILEPRI